MLDNDEVGYIRLKFEIKPPKRVSFTFHVIDKYTNDTLLSNLIEHGIKSIAYNFRGIMNISSENIKLISFRLL